MMDWMLINHPKFLMRGFQNHRLLKTLKYSIFSSKLAEIAHETAKIAQNCHVASFLFGKFSKFPISGFQIHRLLKTLKYAIFSP